jgi:hypothetical protein
MERCQSLRWAIFISILGWTLGQSVQNHQRRMSEVLEHIRRCTIIKLLRCPKALDMGFSERETESYLDRSWLVMPMAACSTELTLAASFIHGQCTGEICVLPLRAPLSWVYT